jgi:hypothetical protein
MRTLKEIISTRENSKIDDYMTVKGGKLAGLQSKEELSDIIKA